MCDLPLERWNLTGGGGGGGGAEEEEEDEGSAPVVESAPGLSATGEGNGGKMLNCVGWILLSAQIAGIVCFAFLFTHRAEIRSHLLRR